MCLKPGGGLLQSIYISDIRLRMTILCENILFMFCFTNNQLRCDRRQCVTTTSGPLYCLHSVVFKIQQYSGSTPNHEDIFRKCPSLLISKPVRPKWSYLPYSSNDTVFKKRDKNTTFNQNLPSLSTLNRLID